MKIPKNPLNTIIKYTMNSIYIGNKSIKGRTKEAEIYICIV
jgi:hypothetical protein